MSEWTIWASGALLLGFVGSGHCLGMCGGIAGALGITSPASRRLPRTASSLLYSLGRVSSYALLGALAGWLGSATSMELGIGPWVRVVVGLLIVLLGLQLVGLRVGLERVEALGLSVWRRMSPLLGRIGPPDRAWKCVALGAVWGFLPCGLVYTALTASLVTGSAAGGALFMACFGLGTVPALVFASSMLGGLGNRLRGRGARRLAGVALVMLGVWAVVGGVAAGRGGGHAHPAGAHAPSPAATLPPIVPHGHEV